MKTWNCEVQTAAQNELRDKVFAPKSSEVQVAAFTVGQTIDLQCKGEVIVDYHGEWQSSLVLTKGQNTEKTPSYYIGKPEFIDEAALNIKIASYKVGTLNPSFLLEKNNDKVTLVVPSFEVASVLEQHDFKTEASTQEGQAQQEPNPYPFLGATKLAYPLFFWISILLLVFLVLAYAARRIYKYVQLKRWQEQLKENQLALSPEKYFYKEVRSIQREKLSGADAYSRIQNAYYTFLEHQFSFPVRLSGADEVAKYIQRKRISKLAIQHLKRNLLELHKVKKNAQSLVKEDVDRVLMSLRKNVDELSIAKKDL